MKDHTHPGDYFGALRGWMETHANVENAEYMKAYMKGQYSFLGIKADQRRAAVKTFLNEHGSFPYSGLDELVRLMWDANEREYQHIAMEWVFMHRKSWDENVVGLFEYMITKKSWWDTVDYIASNPVGTYLLQNPRQTDQLNGRWMESGNMWLERTALLFQLKYKEKTDEELLFSNIRKLADHPDFFIRKAIGWSLRQYSKTNAQAVIDFVETQHLSPLSRKEALRLIPS